MVRKGFERSFAPLEILTDPQVEAIDRAALDVLAEVGVRFEHEGALRLFSESGADVDLLDRRVRLPPGLVEECLRRCPSSFRMGARDPKNDLIVGGDALCFVPFPGMQSINLSTGDPRTASKQEYYDGVTVLDALDNVHGIENYTPYFGFEGTPPVMAILEGVAAQMRNTTKCIVSTGRSQGCERFAIEMARELGMEISSGIAASSPLTFYRDEVQCAFAFLEAGFPVHVTSGPTLGASAPATTAGALVSCCAELMAGVTLLQLIQPGARVMVWSFALQQDMRSGGPAFGAIGNCLHQVALNQVWRKKRIPIANLAPGPSSSKKMDLQCGYEKALGALTAALSGANMVLLHGCICGELTFHPIQAILDDDLAGMIGRFVEGIEISNETLALELIEQIGPIPGHFLDQEHTRKWWKREQFLPKAADRLTYPEWAQAGKRDCIDYAQERMAHILASHKVSLPLSEQQDQGLERILGEARDHYRRAGLIS